MSRRDGRVEEKRADSGGETPAHGGGISPAAILGVASAVYLMLFLGAWLWIRLRGETVPLAGKWGIGPEAGLGVALGLVVAGGSALISRVSPAARGLEGEFRQLLGALNPAEILLLAALSGIAEEVFFRAALQPTTGLIFASLLFGFLHVGPRPVYLVWTVFAVVMGFCLGGLFEWTGGVACPVGLHFTVNALNLGRITRPREEPPSPRNP